MKDVNKIDKLRKDLYEKRKDKFNQPRESLLRPVTYSVGGEWKKNEEVERKEKVIKKPPVSIFKKFFIIALVFFLGTVFYAVYNYLQGTYTTVVSDKKIEIKITGNSFIKAGEDLSLEIEIINNNNADLEFAYLFIEHPKGSLNDWSDLERLPRESLGTINPGQRINRNVKVRLFGEERSVVNVRVGLEYHPEGSNAVFSKEVYYPVTISTAPIVLSMEGANTVVSNQPIALKITATLNTSLPKENPIIKVSYPNNFIFDSASPEPSIGNSVWSLSSLTKNKPLEIEIKGRVLGTEGEDQVFHSYVGTTKDTTPSVISMNYGSQSHKVLIGRPFLNTKVLIAGKEEDEYSVSGGRAVDVSINWSNDFSDSISNAEIIVSLSGNALDEKGVSTRSGFFDSSSNNIVFNRSTSPELQEIRPGQNGSLDFSFRTKSLVGSSNVLEDPTVSIRVSVSGRQTTSGFDYKILNDFIEKIVKVQSDFQIASSAYFHGGELPPKANEETSFIVYWTLSNSANTIKEAKATAIIPFYVDWVGPVAGSEGLVTYNQVSREITWNIGSVAPYTGIKSNKDISFVIKMKPSINQVGSIPTIVEKIELSGVDSFTNTEVKSSAPSITTLLSNDPNFKNINGRVVE